MLDALDNPPPGQAIAFHVDEIRLTTAGRLSASGWAVAEAGVAGVEFYLDGALVGAASLGFERPDIASAHPRMAGAERAGFRLEKDLGRPFEGTARLLVLVNGVGNDMRWAEIEVEPLAAPHPEGDTAAGSEEESIKLFVDWPPLSGKRAAETIRGGLQIEGWALARDGVASIDVSIDGESLGTAKYGIRREDVGTAWQDWENSRLSGYAFPIPARALATGEHAIRVALRTRTGRAKAVEFFIEAEQPPASDTPRSLRRKMSRAEIDLDENVLSGLGWRPLFGIFLSVAGGADEPALEATLQSLCGQAYGRFHLAILCEGEGLRERLEARLAAAYPDLAQRITLAAAGGRGSLVDVVAGRHGEGAQLVLPLSAGDVLGCDALIALAMASGLHPEADFFYADERRRSPVSGEVEAFFKPQFSPELLLATNYIGRVWCAEPDLFQRVGAGLDGWRRFGEYDLVLRCTEAARGIVHVPHVLCERGAAPIDAPGREREALSRAIERRGMAGDIEPGCAAGYYRLRPRSGDHPLVSVVMPTSGRQPLFGTCLAGLLERTNHSNLETILVYNQAVPDFAGFAGDRRINVIDATGPFNFSRVCNLGAAAAKGELLLFLNDDIEVIEPGWLDALIAQAQRPGVGAVGARLLYPDGKIQHAGMFWDGKAGRHAFRFAPQSDPGYFGLAATARNVICVTGACLMMRRAWFEAIGRFDEGHSVVNNDVDLCLRSWENGGRVVYEPAATLVHHELASRADMPDLYDESNFAGRWGEMLAAGDPFYHPHLARDRDDYSADEEPVQEIYAGHPLFAVEDIRRILVAKLDHLGDFISAVPALQRLQAHFPQAALHLLALPGTGALTGFVPEIKEVINFEFFFARSGDGRRELSPDDLATLQQRLAPYRFDLAIDLRKAPDTRDILRLAGARWLAGYDRDGRFPWLDIALEWEGDDKLIAKRSYIGDDLLRLVEAVGIAAMRNRRFLHVAPPPPGRGPGERPLVCVHLGVGTETKQWPAPHFAALIDLLTMNDAAEVVLIGGPDEAAVAREVLGELKLKSSVRSLVGATAVGDLPALLASAALFVGNDSGPKHIAAGLGIPTIGIHGGAADAREWGALGPTSIAIRRAMRCSPCYLSQREQCPRGLACLTDLRPSEVYEVCRQMLVARLAGWAPENAAATG
ncbi:MAG TPA: glycosyltransferase family 9 protein [Stellaceae bacterium]|nr:glycosyltransferase family 9 protein [Stellaceae bacterium]